MKTFSIRLLTCLIAVFSAGCHTTTVPEIQDATETTVSQQTDNRTVPAESPTVDASTAPAPDEPKSPFVTVEESFSGEIVLSSIQIEPYPGGTILAFDTPDGMQAWFYTDSGAKTPIVTVDNAQLACVARSGDDVRIGVIERNATNADFALAIRGYSVTSPGEIHDNWHVSMRGFEPAAGSRCLIRGKREIFMTGTRPHKDKVPYRGLFYTKPHSLQQVLPDSAQIPEILTHRDDRFVTRQIVREPEKSPEWKQFLYRDEGDGKIRLEATAEFLVPADTGWTQFTKTGCLVENDAPLCPETPVTATSMRAIPGFCPNGFCMEWLSASKAWIVRSDPSEAPQILEIPRTHLLLPIRNADGAWLSVALDPIMPDRGTGLEFVNFDGTLP